MPPGPGARGNEIPNPTPDTTSVHHGDREVTDSQSRSIITAHKFAGPRSVARVPANPSTWSAT